MLVSVKSLKEKGFVDYYFIDLFGENAEVDVYEVAKKCADYNRSYLLEWLFTNFKLTKKLIWYYESGEIKIERSFKENGKLDKLVSYRENGKIWCTEDYENGKQNGKVIWYHENGKIRCTEDYKNGKQNGKVIHYYENGKIRCEADYKNGEENGKVILHHESRNIRYEADYENGEQKNGRWKRYYWNIEVIYYIIAGISIIIFVLLFSHV